MLLKTTTGNYSNLGSSDTTHDNTSERQLVPTLTASAVHKHTTTSPKMTYRPDSSEHILTQSITNFEKQNKPNHYGHRSFITFANPT